MAREHMTECLSIEITPELVEMLDRLADDPEQEPTPLERLVIERFCQYRAQEADWQKPYED